jgi:dolichyl-phosphate beta-glucosyltransferase
MPSTQSTLTLIVPVYNETVRVRETIDALGEYIAGWPAGSELIFVDDGSTDETTDFITQWIKARDVTNVSVVCRPHLGKGATVRHGLLLATTDLAAFCDVDLSTPLPELDRIILKSQTNNCLAIGSRSLPNTSLVSRESLKRELAGKLFNKVVQFLLCPGIHDTQCGAKSAPTWIWHQYLLPNSTENGFAWDVEIVAAAFRHKIEVKELGITWSHDNRTTVNVVRDGMNMFTTVVKMRMASRDLSRPVPTLPEVEGSVQLPA